MPCLKRGMAIVGQVVVEGKLRCSRPQGKTYRVVSRLARHGRRGNDHANLPRTCGQDRTNLGFCRQIHFESARTRLREGRAGFVSDVVQVGYVKQVSGGSGAENFDTAGHALHAARGVEYLDGESVAGGSLLIIANALVDYAYPAWFFRLLRIE